MFDHVTIRASNREASERFYETVLRTLGTEKTHAHAYYAEWNHFSLSAASDEKPVTRRLHIGFFARSRAEVDEFWRVGTDAGYRDDGAPGPRPQHVHLAFPADANATVDAFHRAATEAGYANNGAPGERPSYHEGYYGAFVLDPDGNNVEVVNHNRG